MAFCRSAFPAVPEHTPPRPVPVDLGGSLCTRWKHARDHPRVQVVYQPTCLSHAGGALGFSRPRRPTRCFSGVPVLELSAWEAASMGGFGVLSWADVND